MFTFVINITKVTLKRNNMEIKEINKKIFEIEEEIKHLEKIQETNEKVLWHAINSVHTIQSQLDERSDRILALNNQLDDLKEYFDAFKPINK